MQSQSADTASNPVIACTLTAADLRERRQAWFKVRRFITAARLIPGGLSFDFARAGGVSESLADLNRLETQCCAWMSFGVTEERHGIQLAITGVGVRVAFRELI